MNPWTALLRQPVLVGLGAAALALFGVAALLSLPVRSSPIIPARMIDISTDFPGADAATTDKFVTLPLESAMAGLAGIKYVTGTTIQGNSDLNAFLADGADPNTVFAAALAQINAARGDMPVDVQPSKLTVVGDDWANQELNVALQCPPSLGLAPLTAFIKANVIPRFEAVPGIGPVSLYVDSPSLRVNMDPAQLTALGLTPLDVTRQLRQAGAPSATGLLRDGAATLPLDTETGLSAPLDFGALPLAARSGTIIPLSSIGDATIGFSDGTDTGWWNTRPAVYIAAGIAPGGNILTVAAGVRRAVAQMQDLLPPGVTMQVSYDESTNVAESLRDLAVTLAVTILTVTFIVLLSLGALRATLAPLAAILLSLLGAALVMQITGQTLNLFTIIALVLAVGLVVDDAIVVVEDVFRRHGEGEAPLAAASASITRLAPVLAAISSTLVVAFLPLVFLKGLSAALFGPFALVLITAFLLSLVIALTLVPWIAMWASAHHRPHQGASLLDRLRGLYLRLLPGVLRHPALTTAAGGLVTGLCVLLFLAAPRNFVPAPDGLNTDIYAAAPDGASMSYMLTQAEAVEHMLHQLYPDLPDWLVASEQQHMIFGGYTLDNPAEAGAVADRLTAAFQSLPGLSAYVTQENGLPGMEDLPVSIALSGQVDDAALLTLANNIQAEAQAGGHFNYLTVGPGQPQYQYLISLDRAGAARLGIAEEDVRSTIAAALADEHLGQVSIGNNTLNIVAQIPTAAGLQTLLALPIRTGNGALVPLSTIVEIDHRELPDALGSWQGLPSVTIQAQPRMGVSLGAALAELNRDFLAAHTSGISLAYTGPSEMFLDSNRQNGRLAGFGLLGLFFLLAVQFRNLRDPFVVLTTVPLASLGPLLLFMCGGATLNMVTEIALLTVWGLIARQGILFVQVAQEGRAAGLPVAEAARRAASLRFRPIFMITLALMGGAVPLLLAQGPQSSVRYDLGVVMASGMASGFLLSLFAVPALYCLLHRGRHV
jgi:multidrug efflux pump subunit AcrB